MTRKTNAPPPLTGMSPADRAAYVRTNFNAIARDYDRFNDLITFGFHRLWKRRLVRAAGAAAGPIRSLDLCCGTGDISLYFYRMCAPESRLTALDFSPEMLNILKARLEREEPREDVELAVTEGDATDLSRFESETFDAVSIGFGLRNVADRPACLAEIFRVLRPGGRLLVLDVGRVGWQPAAFFHGIFFKRIVPLIGSLLRGSPHEMFAYLPASAEAYPDQAGIKAELERTGFAPVRYRNLFLGAAVLHVAEKSV